MANVFTDYTAWPTIGDVSSIMRAMNQTLNASIDNHLQTNTIRAVIETVKRRTLRDFVVTTETRYYDGNGTGRMEIDEHITISTIAISGWYGNSIGLELPTVYSVVRPGVPKTKLQIFRGSLPAMGNHYINIFPSGRSNIEVTGDFGYDTTIPMDLWLGVAYQAAGIFMNWDRYRSAGFLIKIQEADVAEVRQQMNPFDLMKTDGVLSFESVIQRYKKPSGFSLRKQQRKMI
jgi:hypothetical protein